MTEKSDMPCIMCLLADSISPVGREKQTDLYSTMLAAISCVMPLTVINSKMEALLTLRVRGGGEGLGKGWDR